MRQQLFAQRATLRRDELQYLAHVIGIANSANVTLPFQDPQRRDRGGFRRFDALAQLALCDAVIQPKRAQEEPVREDEVVLAQPCLDAKAKIA